MTLTILLPVVIGIITIAAMVFSIRRDPRWLGNAYLTAAAGCAAVGLVTISGSSAATAVGLLLVVGLVLSPLLILALIVFLIVNGIIAIRREGVRLANALPLALGTGLLVAVVVFFVGLAGTMVTAALAVWVLSICLWAGFLMFCFTLYGFVYSVIVRRSPVDYVVVLGSGLRKDGTVTKLLARRVDKEIAVQVQQRQRGRVVPIVMSGGKGDDERRAEAEAMEEYAISRGVPEELILVEDRSTDTEENLRNSSELVLASQEVPRDGRGMIVSSNYHALRAAVLARKLDLPLQAVGAPVALYYWPAAALREFAALVQPHWRLHVVVAMLVTLPGPLLILLIAR